MPYKFGTTAITGKVGWLIQSTSVTDTAQEALGLNGSGEPAVVHLYQKAKEASFEIIIPEDDSTIPEVGDTFTYASVMYTVMSVSLTESNTDFAKYSITAKRYTTVGLPSA